MTTMDKPMRPLRDIDTNEHFTFSSSLHSAAEPHSLSAFFDAMRIWRVWVRPTISNC
jgi:hypothetical protein